MARIITYGFTSLEELLNGVDCLTESGIDRICEAGAKEYKRELPKFYDRLNRPYAGTANIKKHIKILKGKSRKAPCRYVTFDNTAAHSTDAKINEIAFIQEYGAPRRKGLRPEVRAGRPFIKETVDEAVSPQEKMIAEFNKILDEGGV